MTISSRRPAFVKDGSALPRILAFQYFGGEFRYDRRYSRLKDPIVSNFVTIWVPEGV